MLPLDSNLDGRFPGLSRRGGAPCVRTVDRCVIYGEPLDFRGLCARILRQDTRYLVLDLDGTFHKDLNLGVLLGFELCAYQAYGLNFLTSHKPFLLGARHAFNWRDQWATSRYARIGASQWLLPGLAYFTLARLGWKFGRVRKSLRNSLGPHAMDHILAFMRLNLMHRMAGAPLEDVRRLVKELWRRRRGRQVIEPEDVAWLRAAHPDMKIIVSSASPQVCLEVVRSRYPVHDILCTEIETRDGRASSPHWLHPLFGVKQPRRIAPPASLRQNAYYKKVSRLAARYPDFLAPGVHTVGVSDTKHGEDYPWAEYFKCVADINSPNPFSPLVSSDSPLEEIHSARLLTSREKNKGKTFSSNPSAPEYREYTRLDLECLLAEELAFAENRAKDCLEARRLVDQELKSFRGDLFSQSQRVENTVLGYNESRGADRDRFFDRLHTDLKGAYQLNRRINHAMAPVSREWSEIERAMESARSRI